ncbi:MAG: bifunctional [glutamate--ammonia ligase]-adenylyl-L-tyrosine phosphorylase/[glutamate--ammonia-ligase] adenylyltransferase [Hyphomicrobiales bacterium]|nr:MAG: bifunctional [glutamate--ammonia ligase]-adenylyl-L-tyrosine phosphorylase/[glutamate--ammonia-ligase] adenylyltransferase [Hyphomicrobiales bacterium]
MNTTADKDAGDTAQGRPDDPRLFTRIATLPPPSAKDDAVNLLTDLIEKARKSEGGEEVARLIESKAEVARLLGGTFTNAPFLRDLAFRDPVTLGKILKADPTDFIAQLCEDAYAPVDDEATLMTQVRVVKNKAALTIALADIGGVWGVDEVTRALSDIADATLGAAVRFLFRDANRQGKLTRFNEDEPEKDTGYIVIAMGKHGARELNYSSDIDLIVFFDPDLAPIDDPYEAQPFFVRITKRLVKIMQERTGDGYVFRTDLRLRPDPGATPIAVSVPAALTYYESLGQNWERAALIKARACAGDIAAGEAFLKEVAPFIWRKFLDFAAISDIQSIKRQIHAHKGFAAIGVAGHNVKLGHGGIREVEFFVQTQQLIAGGREPDLRGRRTLDMLDMLVTHGWITGEARDELAESYRYLRGIEHRIQMVNDEQTQTLPENEDALMRVARLAGYADYDGFATALKSRLMAVRSHYAELFEAEPELTATLGNLVFTGTEDDPDTIETLASLGFRKPEDVTKAVRAWHFGRYPAVRSARAREQLTELTPLLIQAISEAENSDAAFLAFDRLVAGLPTGVQFFSILRSNPGLLDLLITILSAAPRLAQTISRRTRVLDALLDPAFFGTVPDADELAERLTRSLGEARDYEDRLDRARIFGQEQMFLIGVRILTGTLSASQAGDAYANLARVIVRTLLDEARAEFELTHGKVPGAKLAVLALGKLGGREMTASSDLDLILLYDCDDTVTASDGPRAITPSQYFIRLTQRLVAALSAPTAEGTVYEVDFRLRPSGNAGPLATRLSAFTHYQAKEAWTWEHMALTRAEVIAGDADFVPAVQEVIGEVLCRERDLETLRADVSQMRGRIEKEKGTTDPWDIKQVAGGLVDIEFIAQYLQLAYGRSHPQILNSNTGEMLNRAAAEKLLGPEEVDILIPAIRLYHNITQVLRLAIDGPFNKAEAPKGLKDVLARAGELPDTERLEAHLKETQAAVRRIFETVVGAVATGGGQ